MEIDIRKVDDIKPEYRIKDDTEGNKINYFSLLPQYLFYFLALILPVFIVPSFSVLSLDAGKAFLTYTVILFIFTLWLISSLKEGKIIVPKSLLLAGSGLLVLIWLLSSLFSGNVGLSLAGEWFNIGTFSFILLGFLVIFLSSLILRDRDKIFKFYIFLFISAFAVFLFSLAHTVFGVNISSSFLPSFNLIGSWNGLSIFSGFIALQALIFLELFELNASVKKIIFILFIFSLLMMAIINFSLSWIIFGCFALAIFVSLSLTDFFNERRKFFLEKKSFARISFFVIFIAIFFILSRAVVSDLSSVINVRSIDVRPSWASTLNVTKDSMKVSPKNMIIGSGPNTFLYNWLHFKPKAINTTMFWDSRFTSGVGTLPSFASETGIIGILSWFIFFGALLFYGLKSLFYRGDKTKKIFLILSFCGSLYLWIFSFIYPVRFLLLMLAFFMTGIFVSMTISSKIISSLEFDFSGKSKKFFILISIIIIFLLGSVSGFYIIFQKYWAMHLFSSGTMLFNVEKNIEESENVISRAFGIDNQDKYSRALSQIQIVKLGSLVSQEEISSANSEQLQGILNAAISYGKESVSINSLDPINWIELGKIYEAIAYLKVNNANQFALDAYKEAQVRSPLDPEIFLSISRTEASLGNMEDAVKNANNAILSKNDYVPAYFHLGGLYFNNKDYEKAKVAFESAIYYNQDYSNARYFLGLIYDIEGEKVQAINQFEKIEKLNPDNQEIKNILKNLRDGRRALYGVSSQPEFSENAEISTSSDEKLEDIKISD